MRLFALPIAAALLATTTAVFGASGDLKVHDTDRQVPLDAKTQLDIRNISGSITLTQAEGRTVTVHAHATSRDSDPSIPKLEVQTEGDKLVVCVRYPNSNCGNLNHGDGDHDDNNHVDIRSDVDVALTIGVPRNIDVSAQTVQGSVIAGDLADNLSAGVVSGSIKIASRGRVRAQTVNGPIEATVSLGAGDSGSFETVNGAVHVIFASGASARISANTLSGSVDGDGVTFEHGSEGFVGHNATAKIGTGDARVSIQTVSGSIRVSKT